MMLNVLRDDELMLQPAPLSKAKAEERRRMEAWLEENIAKGKKEKGFPVKVTVTPILAQLLLERNTINRPISQRNCNVLHSDIDGGRFEYNGASITVSDTGVLIDGQHRLMEVVATGRSIVTNITFGVKESARFTTDVGRSKSSANFLAMKDVPYSKAVASAIAYYLQWKEKLSIGAAKTWVGRRPTTVQIVHAADDYPDFSESAEFTSPCMKTVRSHAVLIFCHYVLWKRYSREAADAFIGSIVDGLNMKRGEPAYYCRERLNQMRGRNDAHAKAELIFKCWNAHRDGETISHLRLGASSQLPKLVK